MVTHPRMTLMAMATQILAKLSSAGSRQTESQFTVKASWTPKTGDFSRMSVITGYDEWDEIKFDTESSETPEQKNKAFIDILKAKTDDANQRLGNYTETRNGDINPVESCFTKPLKIHVNHYTSKKFKKCLPSKAVQIQMKITEGRSYYLELHYGYDPSRCGCSGIDCTELAFETGFPMRSRVTIKFSNMPFYNLSPEEESEMPRNVESLGKLFEILFLTMEVKNHYQSCSFCSCCWKTSNCQAYAEAVKQELAADQEPWYQPVTRFLGSCCGVASDELQLPEDAVDAGASGKPVMKAFQTNSDDSEDDTGLVSELVTQPGQSGSEDTVLQLEPANKETEISRNHKRGGRAHGSAMKRTENILERIHAEQEFSYV